MYSTCWFNRYIQIHVFRLLLLKNSTTLCISLNSVHCKPSFSTGYSVSHSNSCVLCYSERVPVYCRFCYKEPMKIRRFVKSYGHLTDLIDAVSVCRTDAYFSTTDELFSESPLVCL